MLTDWYRGFVDSLVMCSACPRLVSYRESIRPKARFMNQVYWNRPVPPWGDLDNPRLMIVGIAPAAHGGNRTGRMFTGDFSAQFLFKALHECGLSNNPFSLDRGDKTVVKCVYITSAVKCAPPNNRPTIGELRTCALTWLKQEVESIRPRAIVVLGELAWRGLAIAMGLRGNFKHGKVLYIGDVAIFMSYHPSPRNTNTGRLMLSELVRIIKEAAQYAGCLS